MRHIYAIVVLQLYLHAILSDDQTRYTRGESSKNLWPSEASFQSLEGVKNTEVNEDIAWFYERFYSEGKTLSGNNMLHNNALKNSDYLVSLDITGKKGFALLLRTASSRNDSCVDNEKGDRARYVILPKEYSSEFTNDVRCFQVSKCLKEIDSKNNGFTNESVDMIDVEFNCIKDFDSQLSMSIEQDLKEVGDYLEQYSNNQQSLPKIAKTNQPLNEVSNTKKDIDNSDANLTRANVEESGNSDKEFNKNLTQVHQDDVILNNEDLNLFDADEIQLKNHKPLNESLTENDNSNSESSRIQADMPQQRMLDENWNPNEVSKRISYQEDASAKKETQELNQESVETDSKVSSPLQSEIQEDYDKHYVKKLESSYENKFNLMIALYATTFIILIIVVGILIWYCKQQMSSIKRGAEYGGNTYTRDGFESDLNYTKKEGSVDGGGSISTAGQISLGKLTPSTHYKRIESPSLNAVSSRNGSTAVSYGGKSIEAINTLDTLDVFADPKMGSQTSIAERTSTNSSSFPTILPPPPKTPKLTPLRSIQ